MPGRGKNFLHVVQTGSEAHTAQLVLRALTPGVKLSQREADHTSKVKRTWIYTSTPPYASMA
jgi:hypothetical protein